MIYPASPYIEKRDGALRIAETRVSLASVVIGFQEGESPQQIVQSFPTLTLAQVYGAIAYYLENKKMIKEYLSEVQREFERSVPPLSQSTPKLFARLQAAREKMGDGSATQSAASEQTGSRLADSTRCRSFATSPGNGLRNPRLPDGR